MSRSILRMLGLGMVAVAIATGGPALADPPHKRDKHHKEMRHDHKGGKRHHDDRRHYEAERRWDHSHRDVVIRYYDSPQRAKCPPGLVQTYHGCLPRGQAKKRYTVGHRLPDTVVVEVLPYDLMRQLPPPPHGHIYRRVDGDVLLIAEGTKKIIDALVLFSAL